MSVSVEDTDSHVNNEVALSEATENAPVEPQTADQPDEQQESEKEGEKSVDLPEVDEADDNQEKAAEVRANHICKMLKSIQKDEEEANEAQEKVRILYRCFIFNFLVFTVLDEISNLIFQPFYD
jgi:hypothetical protein